MPLWKPVGTLPLVHPGTMTPRAAGSGFPYDLPPKRAWTHKSTPMRRTKLDTLRDPMVACRLCVCCCLTVAVTHASPDRIGPWLHTTLSVRGFGGASPLGDGAPWKWGSQMIGGSRWRQNQRRTWWAGRLALACSTFLPPFDLVPSATPAQSAAGLVDGYASMRVGDTGDRAREWV